ncbi:Na/Pi symporter [Sessilibacter corallicola]|uniref:Na/Pi symporter n=1 Tax=Sessilibacter corallicola TaxID=2904075 RepID=A0ABQ0A690_9GAMM
MTTDTSANNTPNSQPIPSNWREWAFVAALVYLLLVAVSLIGGGFKISAGERAKELFEFASNPITGLVIGTVATALIQSSSTVTSIIVGLVAGGMPVSIAIPMVMGANIGTTITNTIVSLGHIKQGEEFKRAFSAATIHDFFNLLCVIIFLPLEIAFGFLEKIGAYFSTMLVGGDSVSMSGLNFMKAIVSPPVGLIKGSILSPLPTTASGIIMIVLGVVLIFVSITFIGKLLKVLMVGKAKEILHSAVGRGPVAGIASGTAMTVLVQSSSTTTSLIVPLAGTGVFSIRQVYPFTLGANIGTCITGLLAATAISGPNAVFAMEIALVHLFYNLLGVILIYSIPVLRNIPIMCANWLSDAAVKNKFYILLYIFTVFMIIPSVLVFGSKVISA